ncbi:28S ribosomal protein S7, mitochondrial isoform X2 [Centrocercus urophasianus]|uniref:28S ribosomal protein S7, mitochondrial isoform X2 n=1 Tax=Centrocercus urophasianus TaxID=9002 RepID=UPI001C64EDCB|nr:28S ribosomal protein S7, mitochondrial isoform X2 [Centrocercus urophasianus]
MAAPTAAGLRPSLRAWLPRLAQVRWSRYNPSFLEPEVNKELYQKPFNELSEEEKEKQELKAVRPIKAAPPSISSSVFSDPMISKFTNMMMKDGNKVLARSLMAQTLENIKRKQLEKYHRAPDDEKETVECNPYVIFHQALKNCQPIIGLSNITRGGKTYQFGSAALGLSLPSLLAGRAIQEAEEQECPWNCSAISINNGPGAFEGQPEALLGHEVVNH